MRHLLIAVLALSLSACMGAPDGSPADAGVEPDVWSDPCAEYTTTVELVPVAPVDGCAFGRMRAESVHDEDLLCLVCVTYGDDRRDCWTPTVPPAGADLGDHLDRWSWEHRCYPADAPRSCWQGQL